LVAVVERLLQLLLLLVRVRLGILLQLLLLLVVVVVRVVLGWGNPLGPSGEVSRCHHLRGVGRMVVLLLRLAVMVWL
jgi:hypothetical protein